MLPSLLVAAAVTAPAAPMPTDALPNPTGPAPRIVAVQETPNSGIWITAQVYKMQKVKRSRVVIQNGNKVVKTEEVEQMVSNYVRKQIGQFGGKFTTADGTSLTTAEATRRLKDGGTLLVTADGKPVDSSWLTAVSPDTIIMATDELGEAYFVNGNPPYPTTASPFLTFVGPDAKGEVRIPVNANMTNGGEQIFINEGFGGGFNGRINGRVMIQQGPNGQVVQIIGNDIIQAPGGAPATPAGKDGKKLISEVAFDAYDLNGKIVSRGTALKRLQAGCQVIVAGDNRFPDENYLKGFRGDLMVLVSPELTFPAGTPNPFTPSGGKADAGGAVRPNKPVGRPVAPPVQILPVQRGIQVKPAVIKQVQIQVAPAQQEKRK